VPSHHEGAEWLRRAPKNPNNVTSIFFNTVHLIPKDLSFEHGGAKLALAPGAMQPRYAPELAIDVCDYE